MKTSIYHCHELMAYLKAYHYTQTYRQGGKDAYYFGPKCSYIFVPIEELTFSKSQILDIFKTGAEHIQDIEYARFTVFVEEFRLKNP